ncbi:hypothetical protein WN51_02173 [Melipona quadrifasciata]|uniref:Uncharacterized protein n=1 Tax=Melipona quadrifasciata TaxID=166423 RepID=A0A0M8ZW45_9HYME|nr:hypothetical protein WN51_02173 [Melipona quadrifasciata]
MDSAFDNENVEELDTRSSHHRLLRICGKFKGEGILQMHMKRAQSDVIMDLPAPLVNLENGTNLSGAARHGINSQESLPRFISGAAADGSDSLSQTLVRTVIHPSSVPHTLLCLTSEIGRTSTLGAQPLAACASQCSKLTCVLKYATHSTRSSEDKRTDIVCQIEAHRSNYLLKMKRIE